MMAVELDAGTCAANARENLSLRAATTASAERVPLKCDTSEPRTTSKRGEGVEITEHEQTVAVWRVYLGGAGADWALPGCCLACARRDCPPN